MGNGFICLTIDEKIYVLTDFHHCSLLRVPYSLFPVIGDERLRKRPIALPRFLITHYQLPITNYLLPNHTLLGFSVPFSSSLGAG
jgi:hypothetical protein